MEPDFRPSIYCRSGEKAQALAEELSALGVPALAVRADVAEEGQVVRMVDNVLEKFCQLRQGGARRASRPGVV